MLVARGGEPLLRAAYGLASVELGIPLRVDHVFKIGSVTKPITAVAVLRLVDEGKLALDDEVRRHLPGFETHGRRITIEEVLTHTSGLPNLVDLPEFDELARSPHTVAELLALTADVPPCFEPGESFRYSDTGYILLGAIVARVSGLSYAEYVERELFRPLGMRDSWYADDERVLPRLVTGYSARDGEPVRAPWMSMTVPHAAGALASTADDLLRFHLALRAGDVIPTELLERAWSPRTLADGTPSGYGFGFKVCTLAGRRTAEHGGYVPGFLAHALQVPEEDLDVIVLVNTDADDPDPGALARRLARLVLAGSPELPTVALTADERARLCGRYALASGATLEIVDRGGVLHRSVDGRGRGPLAALAADELSPAETEGAIVLSFALGAGERAERVFVTLRCEPLDRGTRVREEEDR